MTELDQLRDISSISRALRKSELPEELIRKLPAQTLYQVIRYNGLSSMLEVVESASLEQTRSLLDFDLWANHSLDEIRLCDWLELTSESDNLSVLQKIANSIDLKIIALLIGNYVQVQQNEDPSEAPPEPLFFSPDKGYTWIKVDIEDERKHFLVSKLLAFLFESNSDVFYQLLATKTLTTPSILEDEAYADRTKRLADQGFPEPEFSAELTSFLSISEALQLLETLSFPVVSIEPVFSEPLVRLAEKIEPLSSALLSCSNVDMALSEMSLLINAAYVRFNLNFSDQEAMLFMAAQVQGAINMGLEILSAESSKLPSQILDAAGLKIPFRVGLSQLLDLGRASRKYLANLSEAGITPETATAAMIELIQRPFPCLPAELSQIKTDFEIIHTTSGADSAETDDNLKLHKSLAVKPTPFRFVAELQGIKQQLGA